MKTLRNQKNEAIDQLCINTIRALSIDCVDHANSGHPGLPLGAAPFTYILWQYHLKHDPKNPLWENRDRFILSAGHGSMLLYSMLHLTGYDLSLDELKKFRRYQSKTPGHPEYHHTVGVECTTGPLGQGAANAVGMAMAEKFLSAKLNTFSQNTLIDHRTYALVSDGDLMEGVSAEAASLAGHLKLGKLIYLYDSNDITLDGPTDLCFSSENVKLRYESYGWQVLTVENADTDLNAIDQAIQAAKTNESQPSLIIFKTKIGFGSPKVGTSKVHGSPLNKEEIIQTKKNLNYPSLEPFFIPSEAKDFFQVRTNELTHVQNEWTLAFNSLSNKNPEFKKAWDLHFKEGALTPALSGECDFSQSPSLATRESSGKAIQVFAKEFTALIGGDADLSCSTNTSISNGGSFTDKTPQGRNIHYGVREHAMAAIANGMSYHGGVRPFVATFFCFSDYMKPSIRLAALNRLPVIYVFTHDSIALGEDGPTHQPVEHLMALRVIPNLTVIRPADAHETQEAWRVALQNQNPTALVLSRQKVATLQNEFKLKTKELAKGAYVLKEGSRSQIDTYLLATGSEVHLALSVQETLEKNGLSTRVISIPSWELFEKQSPAYKSALFPQRAPSVFSIEAGVTLGWQRYCQDEEHCFGVNAFGTSAPYPEIYEHYGLTTPKIVNKILSLNKR